jgi:uncharacterized protein
MMAPAMKTRADERLPYLELAKQGARVVRSVQPDGLTRLAEVAPGREVIETEMTFSIGDDGRVWVAGVVAGVLNATCQRCLEKLDRPLRATFDLCIVSDPALASRIASEADVLVAEGDAVTIAQIVEDELILGLPERLCVEDPCPVAPAFEYPAAEAEDTEPRDNPFSVLSQLKR